MKTRGIMLITALDDRNKLHFNLYSNRKHNITVFTVFFDQINAALVSVKDFFKKH